MMTQDVRKKKILFVSARLPFPAIEGHQIRAYGLIKELSKFSDLHLLSILRPGEIIEKNNPLINQCKSVSGVDLSVGMLDNLSAGFRSIRNSEPLVVSKYVTPQLISAFKQKIEELSPDIVHLDLLPLAALARFVPSGIKVVLNEHNIESDLVEQKINSLTGVIEKLVYKRELSLLRNFEVSACQAVDVVLACSDKDTSIIEGFGVTNVWTIPNGVDTLELTPTGDQFDINSLVFLGGMGWYPNRLGVEWFVNKVLPIIINQNPSVHLHLIGNPEPLVSLPKNVSSHVTKHGFVDDFKPYVANAGMMIIPLHVGSGTRLKVVEGASLGKCMVSTRKGAEGVMLKDQESIVFSDTAQDFAKSILTLQQDREEIIRLGRNARVVAEDIYDWRSIGLKLKEIYSFSDTYFIKSA